ncbi:MAG: hypothetical protein Q8859_03755 [Bacteroidota bacterium]|nr:hypothetical protein [Bacteroidota bacterium]
MDIKLLTFMLCQWGLFLGLALVLFAWAEKKRQLGNIGMILIFVLGLFAIVTNLAGMIKPETDQDKLFIMILWGIGLTGLVSAIGFFLQWKKLKGAFWVQALVIGLALLFFFQMNRMGGKGNQNTIKPVSKQEVAK